MPIQPRSGAQLTQITLVTPAFGGLNKQQEAGIIGQAWATEANNFVFDGGGRLAARQGWVNQTTTPITGTPTITTIFEQRKLDGTTQIILAATNNKLYLGTATPSDITGTATVTGSEWQFVNFNGKVYGVQQGSNPIVYDGTTSFANLTAASGSLPTGNCALAFSGRLWITTSDRQAIKYSALLDATKWATADGAGVFDFTSVWPNGSDEIVAITVYNNSLIVFGKNCILFLSDGVGSARGIDPANTKVYDTIASVGCIARDTVREVEGNDLLFLSKVGIQSLQRLVVQKSNPILNVSSNNRDYLINYVALENVARIKAEYSPANSFYLLSLPVTGIAFCINTRHKLDDGTYPMTTWDTLTPYAMCQTNLGPLYMSLSTQGGVVGVYSSYMDNSIGINLAYASGWMDLGQDVSNYLKILKNLTIQCYTSAQTAVSMKWDKDFSGSFSSATATTGASTIAEYGIAEYGIDEFSGGIVLSTLGVSCVGTGQFIKVGINAVTNNSPFALQQMNIFTKIGRMAK